MTPRPFVFHILCAAGVIVRGSSSDFLLCLQLAKEAKARAIENLAGSTIRVHIVYPSGKRAPSGDVAAALRALSSKSVAAAVARRRALAAQIPPARSAARTDGIFVASGRGLAVAVDVDFCQAGVVAPPDGSDLGTLKISQCVEKGV